MVRLPKASPNQVTSGSGPGQGHVQQTQVFSEQFPIRQNAPWVLFRIQDEVEPPAVGRIVIKERLPGGKDPATPLKRAENNGILQTLAFMDGDDLQGLGITFQSELMFLQPEGLRVPLVLQPAEQLRPP